MTLILSCSAGLASVAGSLIQNGLFDRGSSCGSQDANLCDVLAISCCGSLQAQELSDCEFGSVISL